MKELKLFLSQPHNTRILLITSLIYAFVLPVVDIFVAAYIMRNSSEAGRVVLYQLMVYSGIPITFWLNGFLLKWIKPNYLYSFGMLLSGFSMLIMISLPELHIQGIAVAGLVMGMSFGFFWSNRDYLVIVSTTDENRNYYYGVETFFNTLTFVVVPVIVGLFISNATDYSWIGNINKAYEFVIYVVMFLAIIASLIICRGDYEKPASSKFVYLHFEPVWYKMLLVAWGKGLVQGFIVTAPAMLIMKLVGEEGELGIVQSISSLVTALMMYVIGRNLKPNRRLVVYFVAVWLFFIGALTNSLVFNCYSVLFFLLFMIVARPLFDMAYFPIQMQVIDYLSEKEDRSEYSYIFNHECGLYIGRVFGCGSFIVLAFCVSDNAALMVTLPIVTLLQAITYWMVKNILKEIENEVD